MATASTVNWELTRNEIIRAALRKCQVLHKGQVPSAEDYTDGAEALNALIQTLSTDGMPLWKRVVQSVSLVDAQSDYTISNLWKVAQVTLRSIDDSSQYDLEKKSLYDLKHLPTQTSGHPNTYAYLPGIENGVVRVWPAPDATTAANKVLDVVFQKETSTFNASTDTPDFPVYWTEVLIYGLAHRLAPEYGVGLEDRQDLLQTYVRLKTEADGMGDEDGSLYFQPGRSQ
jgi:hypothetical protein